MMINLGNSLYIDPNSVDAVYPDDRSSNVIIALKSGKLLSATLMPDADRCTAIKDFVDKVNQGLRNA